MLLIEDVCKSYGPRVVLDGVSLEVGAGSIVGLVGSNGAGKTTLISIATGLITADAGRAWVGEGASADIDVARDRRRSAGLIGLAPQELGVYPMLSVHQNLITMGELAGMGRRAARTQAEEIAHALDLVPQFSQRADTLSGGQARRLHTGMALMHRPAVLFLDEPTVGADVAARRAILEVVKALANEGTAVVYTTHYLSELSDLDASVAILHGGRIALQGALGDVVDAHASAGVGIVTSGVRPTLPGWVPTSLPGGAIRWDATTSALHAGAAAGLADALARLGVGTTLEAVDVTPASLETAFLAVTGHALASEPGIQDAATTTTEAPEEVSHVAHA